MNCFCNNWIIILILICLFSENGSFFGFNNGGCGCGCGRDRDRDRRMDCGCGCCD